MSKAYPLCSAYTLTVCVCVCASQKCTKLKQWNSVPRKERESKRKTRTHSQVHSCTQGKWVNILISHLEGREKFLLEIAVKMFEKFLRTCHRIGSERRQHYPHVRLRHAETNNCRRFLRPVLIVLVAACKISVKFRIFSGRQIVFFFLIL